MFNLLIASLLFFNHLLIKKNFFYNNHAVIFDKYTKEYCCISYRLGILKVNDMIYFLIYYEEITEKEN